MQRLWAACEPEMDVVRHSSMAFHIQESFVVSMRRFLCWLQPEDSPSSVSRVGSRFSTTRRLTPCLFVY